MKYSVIDNYDIVADSDINEDDTPKLFSGTYSECVGFVRNRPTLGVDTNDKVDNKARTKYTKVNASEVDSRFILGMAEVLTHSANGKYDRDDWKHIPKEDLNMYNDALMRHIYAYLSGEEVDKESGLSHLYHAGTNLMIINYIINRKDV